MKIVALTAQNLLRLKAVRIEPGDEPLVTISGPNGQGKTSVLNAIWMALGGAAAAKDVSRPIREGETSAFAEIDFGQIIVTRAWTQSGSRLQVRSADGAVYRSPQAMLDDLIGQLSFDPLDFTRQQPKDQVQTLLDLVGLDPTALDEERSEIFAQRTVTGREVKRLKGAISEIDVPIDAPEEEVSITDLVAERDEADEHNHALTLADGRLLAKEQAVNNWEATISRLKRELAEAEAGLESAQEAAAGARGERDLLGSPINLTPFTQRITAAEGANAAARRRKERDRLKDRLVLFEATQADQTAQIDAIDQRKADAVANADMPVEGLGLDPALGVTFNGVPFAQASAAEQLRVSVAMAMALNPTVRVIRITDGSLLDATSMEILAEAAAENDYQVWIERVAESGEGVGFEIHDGEIVNPPTTQE